MATGNAPGGRSGFGVSLATVRDVQDPSQTGKVRLEVHSGSGRQTDQIGDQDRPWCDMLSPTTDAALKGGIGGTLGTGPKVGTKCIVLHMGDESFVIGNVPGGGDGAADTNPTPNSSLPPQRKNQTLGGMSQPQSGDVSYMGMKSDNTPGKVQDSSGSLSQNPLWDDGLQKGGYGQQGKTALYSKHTKDNAANGKDGKCGAFTCGFGDTDGGGGGGGGGSA